MKQGIQLQNWFEKEKRTFPWREGKTPYAVWVSEVMLQQTRAACVVPYFHRWMNQFSTIKKLAEAKEEEVIKLWEGLGYYSRARNLHLGAQEILERFSGKFPDTLEELLSIKGIGPYTAGAILNFAFQKKAQAIDGNVKRVLSRLFAIEACITSKPFEVRARKELETLLNEPRPWVTSEALIELGALVCMPTPSCEVCPLKKGCKAFSLNQVGSFPLKPQRKKVTVLERAVAIIMAEEKVLIQKKETGVMKGLYEFPYFPKESRWPVGLLETFLGEPFILEGMLDEVVHTFTKYRARLYPAFGRVSKCLPLEGVWVPVETLETYPFSSGHRRVLKHFNARYYEVT